MNITKENVDALNAVVKVEISAADYQDKVAKILQDYRKKADIPGFRKGQVPLGMVQKQYGKSIMIDEVNKLLQESLNNFLIIGNLEILNNDLSETMNWTDALNSGNKIGEGWRLPTKDELIILYKNKSKIGRFENNYYWTSTIESNKEVSFIDFSSGNNYTIKPLNRDKAFVRLVRTIK